MIINMNKEVLTLLRLRQVAIHYGQIKAVKGIDLDVKKGSITALVGANGAGKTTTLLGISGLVPIAQGSIEFLGQAIQKASPNEIVKKGIVHVPEGRAILTRLTVQENLELGAYVRTDHVQVKKDLEWVLSLFPRLRERAKGLAGNLSGGEQQMLAIARGLMARPELLILDEPSMGLAPIIVQDIFSVIQNIHAEGVSILLVEQNVKQALKIAQAAYVLETGNIVLSGTGQALLNDQKVIAAYLGT